MRRGPPRPLLVLALVAVAAFPALDGAAGQAGASSGGDADRGAMLFGRAGCNGCHTIGGVGGQVGPDLTGIFGLDLAAERPGQDQPSVGAYVRQSIEDPQAYIVPGFPQPSPMPSAETFGLTEQDIADLLAYLERAGAAEAR